MNSYLPDGYKPIAELPSDYEPTESEEFMNDLQREFFRRMLLEWKGNILKESSNTLENLKQHSSSEPDLADRASAETDRAVELRARDRHRKLLNKINAALSRIESGSYGFCEETGDPISLKRLAARPIATLSIDAQERHEHREKIFREE